MELVSVIIPTYNGEKYLKEALDSIINQSYPHVEVIVVDDGSTDNTPKILEQYPQITTYFQTNQGNATARNFGVKASHGKWIAFLDQDDIWTPDKLALQTEVFLENPEIQMVFAHCKTFIDPSSSPKITIKEFFYENSVPAYVPGTWLVDRNLFDQLGFFQISLFSGSDLDWVVRIRDAKIQTYMHPKSLLKRRFHANNLSHDIETQQHDLFTLVRNSLERKKQE